MPRPLLFSEQVTLRVLLPHCTESDAARLCVHGEYFSQPRTDSRQWFNTDFFLEFAPLPPIEGRTGGAYPIRQHTIGAELFFIIDEDGKPASLELLSGEAFPKKSYISELDVIEAVIGDIPNAGWPEGVRTAPFLRVFDFPSCIVFSACSATDIAEFSSVGAKRHRLEGCEIECRCKDEHSKIIEGVIYR